MLRHMRDRDSTSQRACKPQNAALNQQKLSTLPDTYQAKLWHKGTVQACLNPHSVDKKKGQLKGRFNKRGSAIFKPMDVLNKPATPGGWNTMSLKEGHHKPADIPEPQIWALLSKQYHLVIWKEPKTKAVKYRDIQTFTYPQLSIISLSHDVQLA